MNAPSPYPDLAGQVAVVSGGSRGIGAATARALARSGAAVALLARDEDALATVADAITGDGGQALALRADCTEADELRTAAQAVAERLGPATILAAFAGGDGMPVPTAQETAAHWRAVVDGNLTATFLTVSAFLPALTAAGHGSIITMASAAGRQAGGSSAAYAAAKAGVIGFTRHLAAELAGARVRVNCLAPSAVENDRMRTWMTAEQRAELAAAFPLGRIGQPEDVAAATLFLASEASGWITGITLDVAGGKVMV